MLWIAVVSSFGCRRSEPDSVVKPAGSVMQRPPAGRGSVERRTSGVADAAPPGLCAAPAESHAAAGKPLSEDEAFTGAQRPALRAVRDELRRVLDDPREYRAKVDEGAGLVVVELTHVAPRCSDAGSASTRHDEKNRTFVYDSKRRRLISTKWAE